MVTIKQIAQEVGISSSTVSIVLGGKAAERKISTATQKKIFAAAARLGYQPNMAARSLPMSWWWPCSGHRISGPA